MQLQLVLDGSEARERGGRHRAAVEDRRPAVVVGLDVAPDDAQVKPRALGVERRRSPTCSPSASSRPRPTIASPGPRDHAAVADRVGPALVVAAERARPHVDRAAGHGGRGPRPPSRCRRPSPTARPAASACERPRPRWRRRSARRAWRAARVLDDAPVGRLGAQRHDTVPMVSARLAIVIAARERLAKASLTPRTTAGGRRSAAAARAARDGFVLTRRAPRGRSPRARRAARHATPAAP